LKFDIFGHIYHSTHTEGILELMSIKINYSNKEFSKSPANLVLFVDEKFSSNNLKKYLSNSEFSYINDLLKTNDLKKNMFTFEVNSKKKNSFNFY
jgi:leucyl aminopeptidase